MTLPSYHPFRRALHGLRRPAAQLYRGGGCRDATPLRAALTGIPDPDPDPDPNPSPNPSPDPSSNPSPNPSPNPGPNPSPNPNPNPTPAPTPHSCSWPRH
eukprot:scaffold16340_cov33-Phaeocystis_antarctica.AAC.3